MRMLRVILSTAAAPLLTLPLVSSSTLMIPEAKWWGLSGSPQFAAYNHKNLLRNLGKDPEELHCLALNIYHEARSEPESGQIAVAQVTLNRVVSNRFPDGICAVVKQGGQELHQCQFSWWCDGRSDEVAEPKAWEASLEIAERVLRGEEADLTQGALFYHAHYVNPSWSEVFKQTVEIGQHRFYRPHASEG